MQLSTEIYNELNEISPLLAGIEKRDLLSVPEGYFDTLPIAVLKKINVNSEEVMKVPEGYFENLSETVLTRIKALTEDPAQELRALSPMLYSIQNENVFEVPAGYFRNLGDDILSKIKPRAKIVSIKKKDSVWRYAAAAVVTGVIALSSLMIFNSPKQDAVSKANQVAVSSSIKDAAEFKSEQQVNAAIAGLSDEEIIKFLEKTGTDVDNEALASGIDPNQLPEPTDYLLDEKTLDSYLDQGNKNAQN